MLEAKPLRVFLVDDEALALKRLTRLLRQFGTVEIIGEETDPIAALATLKLVRATLDALFLDIQMPGLNGFELLAQLDWQPLVVFTTAYDEYALRAFEVHSIDYLLKPIEETQLERALQKLTRLQHSATSAETPDSFQHVIAQLAHTLRTRSAGFPTRVASKVGERVRFIELTRVTHFFAQDKLTYAATAEGQFVVDRTIAELEQELDPQRFIRIHRAILLNGDFVEEVHAWFGGRLRLRLKDEKQTELTVARERVKALKETLGF
jgi:two-component system, LytTR family, response regulator